MGKQIMVLNGSPRPRGNTAGLIRAFTEGAEERGHTVAAFALDSMHIAGCKGCYGGGKDPESPCVQKDDMDSIYAAFRAADVVVLASPLYFWHLSGQLRTAFDRLFAVVEGAADFQYPHKESILLMAAEGDEFNDAVVYYENLMQHLGWNSLGKVLAGGVTHIGDIEGKPVLEEARALGRAIR